MKKFKNFVLGGIQNKIFNLVAITIMLIVLAHGVVIFSLTREVTVLLNHTNEKQQESIAEISNRTMENVVEGSLGTTTNLEAYIADDMFDDVRSDVEMISKFVYKLDKHKARMKSSPVGLPDPSLDGESSAQLLMESGVDIEDPEIAAEIELFGNAAGMMIAQFDTMPELNSCFIASPKGFAIVVDDRSAAKYDEKGNLIPLAVRSRPWYTGAVKEGDCYFTDVQRDRYTDNVGIVCSYPVYNDDGELVAVVGADLFVTYLSEYVRQSEQDTGYIVIINQNGRVAFSPMEEGVFKVQTASVAADLRKSPNAEFADFIATALKENTGVRSISVDGKDYYMSGMPIETVGWAVVSVVDKEPVLEPTKKLQTEYQNIMVEAKETFNSQLSKSNRALLILLAITLALGSLNGLVLAKKIVKPLESMTKQVTDISGDNIDFQLKREYKTGDEIEVLAESFASLSARTKSYIKEITRITAEKERIGAELNVATKIQADLLPRIFPAFPGRKEFDLYATMSPAKEVGGDFYDFFLIDSDHLALVMADVSGKGVPAALFMVITKTLIKNRTLMGGTPGKILRDVNYQLCEGNEAQLFVTAWMAIITLSTGEGVVVNAGHEHPVLCRKNGLYRLQVYKHSPALALFEDIPFREREFLLEPGDSIFVYTDGVPEATNEENEMFGTDRMLDVLNESRHADPAAILENMSLAIDEFMDGAGQFDDITMLSFTYYGNRDEE